MQVVKKGSPMEEQVSALTKLGVLVNTNFVNTTRKHLCWSLFEKAADPKNCNSVKKRLQHRCFPVKFSNFLRTPFWQKSSSGCF